MFSENQRGRARPEFDPDADLAFWAGMLRRGMPHRTDEQRAVLWAEILTTRGVRVTERTVRNWLNGDATPHFRYWRPVMTIAGAEFFLKWLEGRG